MTDLAAIRAAVKTRLESVDGLNIYDFAPASPQLPAAVVNVEAMSPHSAFEATDVRLGVVLLVQLADWESAQRALDGYISTGTPTSVVDAIEADPDIVVDMIDSYGSLDLDTNVRCGTVTFHITVNAP